MSRVLAHELELEELLTVFSNKLVILAFHPIWCGACERIASKINHLLLTPEYENLVVISIDVDEFEEVARKYSVRTIPTYLFLRNGVAEKSMIGTDFEKFQTLVRELL